MTQRRTPPGLILIACLSAWPASLASAQDSVALTAGNSDALSPYNHAAIVRYVVDTVPLASSWGNQYRIAPILKASNDEDPLFSTMILGSSAVSPDQMTDVSFPSTLFSVWTAPGQGVNPDANSAPSSISVNSFTRRFGVGFSDLIAVSTNVIGALVGQQASNPNRLFVTRTLAAASRYDPEEHNTSTLSLGGIDASGFLLLRADNFNCTGAQVVGENIVRINLSARNAFLNTLFFSGASNSSDQPAATTYLINGGTTTTNTPAVLPLGGTPALGIVLDFSNKYRPNGGAGIATHLAPGIAAHRGNPSFSTINSLGGVGTVASLARSTGSNRTDSINLFAVNSSAGVVAARAATLPLNITDGQGFTANTTGQAEFRQYLSQTPFRGGNGQVAVGLDPMTETYIAAATAADPVAGEFIAVARFGASVTWTVAAHVGKAVLDGPSGSAIGTIASATPISLSAPGADRSGNIYFVAAFQPTVGAPTTAFIKAVRTASGYRLERLLQGGQSFTGANSTRVYIVERLTLGDSDSIASGSFFSGHVLQPLFPNETPASAADPKSFGGAIVNAQITYDNAGVPETYQTVLFVAPSIALPPPVCTGDANGDNMVTFADITAVLVNFGVMYPPGQGGPGDANFDGTVNFADITTVLVNFGANCG